MSSYIGRHAELYDLFYETKPYRDEAAFVDQCLKNNSQTPVRRILELACGTGTHAIELERLGYEVVATDYSQDMLACAKKKSQAAGSQVEFQLQDMRHLPQPEQPFDAVVCLFDSIGYVGTNEGLHQTLSGVKRQLCSGGLFIFEFWHAGAMIRGYDPTRVRRWPIPGGEIVRISETTLDYKAQLAEVRYSIYENYHDGTSLCLQETQTNRFFLVQEMAYWLTSHGFSPVHWYSGFTSDETINADAWHLVAVARCD